MMPCCFITEERETMEIEAEQQEKLEEMLEFYSNAEEGDTADDFFF